MEFTAFHDPCQLTDVVFLSLVHCNDCTDFIKKYEKHIVEIPIINKLDYKAKEKYTKRIQRNKFDHFLVKGFNTVQKNTERGI